MVVFLTILLFLLFYCAGISFIFAVANIKGDTLQYLCFSILFVVATILGCFCGSVRDDERDTDIEITNYTVDTAMTVVKGDTTYTYILNFERE